MSTQNPYNNYMKRQNKKPINNFKEKVANSLGGVPTQQKTGNIASSPLAQKPPITTPPVANQSTPTQPTQPNPAPIPNATPQAVANQPIPNATPQTDGGATGLMSASQMREGLNTDVNNAPTQPTQNPSAPINQPTTIQEVNELANTPEVQAQAYSTGKTPQQMAQELLEQQKAQLQKDWEIKQAQLAQQQKDTEDKLSQSQSDLNKEHDKAIQEIDLNRYQQMQDLNVSGTNRGIAYSPQQLGLENVANINHGKNISSATEKKMELLTDLKTQYASLMAQMTLGSQNSLNEYNKALGELNAGYQKQMMDWTYNDQQTESDRAWQELQTQKDREWQEKMDNANKEWQSKENALDREKSRSGGSGGGRWSGGSSFKPYSSRRYGGSSWDNMGGYDYNGYDSDYVEYDMNDTDYQDAYVKNVMEGSSDAFNALKAGGMYDLKDRRNAYMGDIDSALEYGKQNGLPQDKYDELGKKRDIALNTMYNRAYASDTNGSYKIGNTAYPSKQPLRKDFIDNTIKNKHKTYSEHSMATARTPEQKFRAKIDSKVSDVNNRMAKNVGKNNNKTTKKSNLPSSNPMSAHEERVAKYQSSKPKSTKTKKKETKVSKPVKKSVGNSKKATNNSKKNSKTSGNKSKKNSESAIKKSINNLKKNYQKRKEERAKKREAKKKKKK